MYGILNDDEEIKDTEPEKKKEVELRLLDIILELGSERVTELMKGFRK